ATTSIDQAETRDRATLLVGFSDLMSKGLISKRLQQDRLDHRAVVRQLRFGNYISALPLLGLVAEALPQDVLEFVVRDEPHGPAESAPIGGSVGFHERRLVKPSAHLAERNQPAEV